MRGLGFIANQKNFEVYAISRLSPPKGCAFSSVAEAQSRSATQKTDKMQNAPESVMFVLLSSSNRWARGRSMFSAASALVKAGGKRTDKVFGIMVCNDPEPSIDSTGRICYGGAKSPDAYTVEIGNLGKVGGLIA